MSVAQQANPPSLPRIDQNACPFECCQFGRWTAKRKVSVYSNWHRSRRPVFDIHKGEIVTAITGVYVTYTPGHLRALKDIPELQIRVGDTVLTYTYRGEGQVDYWVNGRSGSDEMATSLPCSDASKQANAPFCMVDEGKKEWWVSIKTGSGKEGWVEGNIGFDGTDACA